MLSRLQEAGLNVLAMCTTGKVKQTNGGKLPGKKEISYRMMEGCIKYITSWECSKEILKNSVINIRNEI